MRERRISGRTVGACGQRKRGARKEGAERQPSSHEGFLGCRRQRCAQVHPDLDWRRPTAEGCSTELLLKAAMGRRSGQRWRGPAHELAARLRHEDPALDRLVPNLLPDLREELRGSAVRSDALGERHAALHDHLPLLLVGLLDEVEELAGESLAHGRQWVVLDCTTLQGRAGKRGDFFECS